MNPVIDYQFNSSLNKNAGNLDSTSITPHWNYSAPEILALTKEGVTKGKHFYDSVAKLDDPSVETFILPCIAYENSLSSLINQLGFLQHVSSSKEIRDASTKAAESFEEFEIDISLRHDLFLQFHKIWEEVKEDLQFKEDHYETFKFIEKCHKDFLRAGLNLSSEKREQVQEIKKKISANCLQFSKNLGEEDGHVALTREELEGVSAAVISQLDSFVEDGVEKFKVSFKYPDIFPILKSANNSDTRRRIYLADENKLPQNEVLLLETLKLRSQLANLLDYSTYADYSLDIKMAKKVNAVSEFLDGLVKKLEPLAIEELKVLKALKQEDCQERGIPYDGHYYGWDNRYYSNMMLKSTYNVDEEKISEFFPLESAILGMLEIYETVFKLKFMEETNAGKKRVWHDDVKQYAVWKMDDEKHAEFVGWIYFDLHPREGKYGHAANFGITPSHNSEDGKIYPVTALVCNFSKPSKEKPALLKHNEISTFFHELGHGIHDLVGMNQIGRFNGPNSIPWDFVEAPSQMLEFWTWNKQQLLTLSRHYKTNNKIPDTLLDSLVASKHVNGALFALRQLHFSIFDMTVHTSDEIEERNIASLWCNLREKISLVESDGSASKGYNSFGHIMSGEYAAGYYGYMWAEVFAADMYHEKFAADPLNSEVGRKYRDIILGRGGVYEIDDNLQEFLGRKPTNAAFLKELGLSQ